MIVLGLSGLPQAQAYYLKRNPSVLKRDRRICQGMDSAAALVVDGEIVAAAEEERFTGEKATGAFPAAAIEYCLADAGLRRNDVDVIAHGFDYDSYRRFFATDVQAFENAYAGATVVQALEESGWQRVAERFRRVQHHQAHAASAFATSGFESALTVVSDGMGEIDALSVFGCRGERYDRLHHQGIATSLGIAYSLVTRFLGFSFNSDEYKVMGLSAYGVAARHRSFTETFLSTQDGSVDVGWPKAALSEPAAGYPHAMAFLAAAFGVPPREPWEPVDERHADVAASFQERFSEVLRDFVRGWLTRTGESSLCLAGGTFLNCLANESIGELAEVDRLFVPPASGDDGTSIGAALAVSGRARARRPYNPYSGPSYSSAQVLEAVEDAQGRAPGSLVATAIGVNDDYFARAAEDIASDRIIAWFHGRMEFGPRALGNRSILAQPAGERIKDRLNLVVKQRESFRPFAPAVLDEDFESLFESRLHVPSHFMLMTARTRPEVVERLGGAVHADGTARVQVVTRERNEPFWRLLREVKRLTGIGCVINTSFNVKNQPIIADPATAVAGLLTMSLDRLYAEGMVISPAVGGAEVEATIPAL